MKIASFFVPLLTLLYNPWRCLTYGESGDHDLMPTTESTSSSFIPRCEPAHQHGVCSLIRSPTEYQMAVSNQSEFILRHVSGITGNKTSKCSQFIAFALCFYLFRNCELGNVSDPTSGSQLIICSEKCTGVTELYKECISVENLQLAVNTQNEALRTLFSLAARFVCSEPDTYIIPHVPVSNKSCDNFSYIDHLLPSDSEGSGGFPSAVRVGVSVGTPLLLLILITAVVSLVMAVLRLRKTKNSLQRRLTERELIEYQLRNEQSETNMDFKGIEDIELSSEERSYYMERFDQSVVAFDQLEMAETVGEGTFGMVYKAKLVNDHCTDDQSVAVKMARNLSSKQELRSLLNESLLMRRFDHPNIVGLLGVCFDTPDGYPYLILPYMINGNVRDYLKDKRVHHTNTAVLPDGFSVKTLLTMCVDVAKGMEYLSSNKFVHRDLAARNCMLDEKGVVRVGDFGLSRDVYTHLYYKADKHSKIPVKWSAPETLNDGLCTEKSDVWSYGVVCWEVFSLGSTPYPGVANSDILQYIVSGERLKKPPLCPQNMYVTLESCWKLRPEERPHFKQLVSNVTLL